MFGWIWTEASVLGSQVFGRALMESCELIVTMNICEGWWWHLLVIIVVEFSSYSSVGCIYKL